MLILHSRSDTFQIYNNKSYNDTLDFQQEYFETHIGMHFCLSGISLTCKRFTVKQTESYILDGFDCMTDKSDVFLCICPWISVNSK